MKDNTRISINPEQYTALLRTLQGLGGFGGNPDVSALATELTLEEVKVLIQTFVDSGYVKSAEYFIKDGVRVPVGEDSGTPSNSTPLPVKITSTSGDINITAGDLNVQLSHTGLNPDSVQIGDGTDLLGINSDGSINVNTSNAVLDSLNHVDNTSISNVTPTQIHAAGADCKLVIVTANENNTGWIRIGGPSMTVNSGVVLYPTESYPFAISNTNILYAIAEVDGEDVSLTYSI